jgi:hypothetical protein
MTTQPEPGAEMLDISDVIAAHEARVQQLERDLITAHAIIRKYQRQVTELAAQIPPPADAVCPDCGENLDESTHAVTCPPADRKPIKDRPQA